MTLPSKGLRKITVDGEAFAYRISKANTEWIRPEVDGMHMDHPEYFNVYIQAASNPKSICRHTHAFEPAHQDWPSITPASVADMIRRAKILGWKPHEAGKFFTGSDSLDSQSLLRIWNGKHFTPEETAAFVRRYNRKLEIRHHK